MADNDWIQEMVGRVVSQVLQSQIPSLRDELVRRVLEELQLNSAASSGASRQQLLQTIASVRQASGQKEILSALLDGASRFSSRAALFVVRGDSVIGWQGRALSQNDEIKNFELDATRGIGAQVLREKVLVAGTSENFDPRFCDTFAAPHNGQIVLLPLLLKEKVAAVIYADAGAEPGGQLDDAALEMLVLSSGLWLEIVALRHAAAQESEQHEPAPAVRPAPVEVEAAAPAPVAMPVVAEPEPVAEAQMASVATESVSESISAESSEPPPMAMAAAAAAAGAGTVAAAPPAATGEDDAIHRKARRFAKLLVDEIKLYNKSKVQEGKANCDLYDRLKEDIEKSRATYNKRYGSTAAASADYFNNEVVRSLAEDDASLLGPNFHR